MTHEQLKKFREGLRTEDPKSLIEQCRELFNSDLSYDDISPVVWDSIAERSLADPSWLPAASVVNHTDVFSQMAIQRPEDKHKVLSFGEPWPEFRRVETPPPLSDTLEELKAKLPEVAATHDWLLTERCLLGIAQQSAQSDGQESAKELLKCIVEQLLTAPYLGDRSGPWWSETRVTTARCMFDAWQRYGDEAIIPFACRYGARLCARSNDKHDELKQNSTKLLVEEYAKLGIRERDSNRSFDEATFREQLSSTNPATVFGAITRAWQQGTTLEQIELAMTMLCVERLLRAGHGDGANWDNLRNELMAVANITRLKALDETLAIQSAYHAAYVILRTGEKGLAEDTPASNDEATTDCDDPIKNIINQVKVGNPSTAIAHMNRFTADGGDALELFRRLFLAVGYDNTYAGQRCMIDAWRLAEHHPERNRIPAAMVGWEASYRKGRFKRPRKGPAQILAEQNSEANVFTDNFEGLELSDQWRCRSELFGETREVGKPMHRHTPIVVQDGVLRMAPLNSNQLVTLRQDFTDFVLTVDLRIICHLVGIIVRWNSPTEYYMVQVGIPWGNQAAKKVGGWHAFSPIHRGGWERENMMANTRLVEKKWYRLSLRVKEFRFTLSVHSLNDDNNIGETTIDALEWEDPDSLFTSGGIGFWEDAGKNQLADQAEFRNLKVHPLD